MFILMIISMIIRINNEPLLEKEEFSINLNKKDIADADHMHAKRVCKDFSKKLDEYHSLHLKNDILL